MEPYKKIIMNGKPVHCYGFANSQAMGAFDPATYSFGKFSPGKLSVGLSIEPLYGEYLMNATQGLPLGLPDSELQSNSACLFFMRPRNIDTMIGKLTECKKMLQGKLDDAAREEYRRKYCGQVIQFSDIPAMKQAAADIRMARVASRCAPVAIN